MRAAEHLLDGSAIGLSGLCLVHCLLLPLAAALLPVLGAWADAESVHVAFVAVAAPLSLLALLGPVRTDSSRWPLMVLAAIGIVCLALGAFVATTAIGETGVTVVGSLLLAGAHLLNWRRRGRAGHCHSHALSRQS